MCFTMHKSNSIGNIQWTLLLLFFLKKHQIFNIFLDNAIQIYIYIYIYKTSFRYNDFKEKIETYT